MPINEDHLEARLFATSHSVDFVIAKLGRDKLEMSEIFHLAYHLHQVSKGLTVSGCINFPHIEVVVLCIIEGKPKSQVGELPI